MRTPQSRYQRPHGSARPVVVLPQLSALVAMLLMVSGMMAFMLYQANRLATEEPDRGGQLDNQDAMARAGSPVQAPAHASGASSSALEPVELSRLSEFTDYARKIPSAPYYYLLNLARTNSAESLEQQARRDTTLVQLAADPDHFRGQLIYLRGRLRRLIKYECIPNEYGLETCYEGWLYTNEAGRSPYAVIVCDPPTGLPLGGDINEPVSVAGYFLGWWKYQTLEAKAWATPLILGVRFTRLTPPALRPDVTWSKRYGPALGVLVLVLLLAGAFFTARSLAPRGSGSVRTDEEPLVFEELPRSDAENESVGEGEPEGRA